MARGGTVKTGNIAFAGCSRETGIGRADSTADAVVFVVQLRQVWNVIVRFAESRTEHAQRGMALLTSSRTKKVLSLPTSLTSASMLGEFLRARKCGASESRVERASGSNTMIWRVFIRCASHAVTRTSRSYRVSRRLNLDDALDARDTADGTGCDSLGLKCWGFPQVALILGRSSLFYP
jgi:hypothetical protein